MEIKTSTYTSTDFYRVSDTLKREIPDKLIHKQVLTSTNSVGSHQFTQERNHVVKIVDLPTKTISMSIGVLETGQSTRRHRHNYETIIYVVEGHGITLIEDREVPWEPGDAIYVPVWTWHHHTNLREDRCVYIACENAPLLQNLGNIALREES